MEFFQRRTTVDQQTFQLVRIAEAAVKKFGTIDGILEEFEKYDGMCSGVLDIANFKTCLLNLKLGFSVV
jgi:hypothetical protein